MDGRAREVGVLPSPDRVRVSGRSFVSTIDAPPAAPLLARLRTGQVDGAERPPFAPRRSNRPSDRTELHIRWASWSAIIRAGCPWKFGDDASSSAPS